MLTKTESGGLSDSRIQSYPIASQHTTTKKELKSPSFTNKPPVKTNQEMERFTKETPLDRKTRTTQKSSWIPQSAPSLKQKVPFGKEADLRGKRERETGCGSYLACFSTNFSGERGEKRTFLSLGLVLLGCFV